MTTEVIKENMDGVKEFIKIAEVRHLPEVIGNFVIADKTDYAGSPETENGILNKLVVSNVSSVTVNPHSVIEEINLLEHYNNPDRLRCGVAPDPCASVSDINGDGLPDFGALPIQTPVSPNGKYVVQANTLSNTITIIDTDDDALEKALPCDAGCHGVNFGAKKGGGYYAYVTSRFANTLIVVDIDPNNDDEADDAVIAGRIVLDAINKTKMDDAVSGYPGMGGQGVLPVPLVYNGWVQNLPENWKAKLTEEQLNHLGEDDDDEEEEDN